MNIDIISKGKYRATVMVDGVRIGDAIDCDGRWIVTECEDDSPFFGAFPANDVVGFGYALHECIDGVTRVTVDGVTV